MNPDQSRCPAHRRYWFELIGLGLALLLAACTADPARVPTPSPAPGTDGSVHAVVPGVQVDGGPGSISMGGTASVNAVAHPSPKLGSVPIAAIGHGVDVTFSQGAQLNHPLTLSFEAATTHKRWVPAVAHKRADDSWELRAVSWDGTSATLSTDTFSENVLVWFDPAGIAAGVRDQLVQFLTGRKPGKPCPGGAHTWSTLEDHEDLVHACLTRNDGKAGGERAELRLSPNRHAYVEVTVPKGVDYVWVKDQTPAFRHGLAKVMGGDTDRTVFLGPDDEMTIGWRKPRQGTEQQPTVRVEASQSAMWISLFEGSLEFDGFSIKGERTAGLILLGRCATAVGNKLVKSNSGVVDALKCLAERAAGNLSDPKTAVGAAQDFLGSAATKAELQDQTKRLTDLGGKLPVAGHLIKLISVIKSVRTALLATYGTVADQLETLLLNGNGTSIIVQLRSPAELAGFAKDWYRHGEELIIRSDGTGKHVFRTYSESLRNAAGMDFEYDTMRFVGFNNGRSVLGRVTAVRYKDSDGSSFPPPEGHSNPGDTFTYTLKSNGALNLRNGRDTGLGPDDFAYCYGSVSDHQCGA